jgi:hypothetical protein
MFVASLFAITEIQKQFEYPSTAECISKICQRHTMTYYPSFKRKEIQTHVMIWMNFKDILLNEIVTKGQLLYNFRYMK